MRWLGLLLLLFAGFVGLLWAAEDKKPDAPVRDFLVHEWGVWRVHDEMDLANADMRAEWNALPAFVYGQTTTRDFPSHWDAPPIMIDKPVIFFHAPRALSAEVRVDFPTGVPAVWWPATEHPGYHRQNEGFGLRKLEAEKPEKAAKYLEWKMQLKQPLGALQQPPQFAHLSKPHWMQTLRDVKCDEVFVSVGQRGLTMEREKFVYYDGLLPRVKALAIQFDKEAVSLKNQEKFTVFDVWVIDNRVPAKPRVGRLPRLDAAAAKVVDLAAMNGDRWIADAGKMLTAQLRDAGLNEDEAAALTTIWIADLFQSAGLTLIYRLPQEEYERLLPLAVKPRPEKTVRVGLVQQVPSDPALAERIARLVKQLDDDSFIRREAAQQELAKLGSVALGYLQRLKATIAAPEPKRRIEELLEKHDAQRTLSNQGE